jgi:hypothetical protein
MSPDAPALTPLTASLPYSTKTGGCLMCQSTHGDSDVQRKLVAMI